MKRRLPYVAVTAVVSAALMVIAMPGLSAGSDPVAPGRQAVSPVTTVQPVQPAASSSRAAAATDPYVPPLHGTNPHATGTAAVIDLNPSGSRPLSLNPVTSSASAQQEDIVLGRAIGEQRADGSYHGHITILAALGNEILAEDTTPGQSTSGPLSAAQTAILDNVCKSLGLCVQAVVANSSTTSTGTTNHFQTVGAQLGATGTPALDLGVVSSNGNISTSGPCQVAHSDSSVANLNLTGTAVGAGAAVNLQHEDLRCGRHLVAPDGNLEGGRTRGTGRVAPRRDPGRLCQRYAEHRRRHPDAAPALLQRQ